MRSEGLYVNKKSTDTSWDRTSDLPICMLCVYLFISSRFKSYNNDAFNTVGEIEIIIYVCFMNTGCRFIQSIGSAPEKVHNQEPSSDLSVLAVRYLTVAGTQRTTDCLIKWE